MLIRGRLGGSHIRIMHRGLNIDLGRRGRSMRALGRWIRLIPKVKVEEVWQEGDRNAGGGRDLEWWASI